MVAKAGDRRQEEVNASEEFRLFQYQDDTSLFLEHSYQFY